MQSKIRFNYLFYGIVLIAGIMTSAYIIFTQSQERQIQADAIRQSDMADQAFITKMVSHHEATIIIASQAKDQAENTDIRSLGQSEASSQQAEIDEMRAWYRKWYGASVPRYSSNPHAGHGAEGTPKTFDEGFVSIMIPHEKAGAELARLALPKARHQEVKDLAATIIWRVPTEIATMKNLP